MKTIAVVANSTWNIYNFRLPLLSALKEAGYQVLVIAPVDEYISYLNDSYFTRHIPLNHLKPLSLNPIKELRLFFELRTLLKKEKPDLILNYTVKPNIYCSMAAASLGIPVIATLTGLGSGFNRGGILNGILTRLYRLGLEKVSYTVFHNEEDRILFHEKKITNHSRSMVVRGSGVDTIRFNAEPRKDGPKFQFLFVGRMIEEKGIREFAEAARRSRAILPQAEFLAVGPFEENDPRSVLKLELLEWVESGTIKYFGSQKDILPFLRAADCLVLPSYREGLPRSVIEAMAVSLPVITTDVPGCRSAVENEVNGLLVPARNSTALAEAMFRIYNMTQEERMAVGRRNRMRAVAEFDVSIIVETYLELIKKILDVPTEVDEKSRNRKGFFQ